MYTPLYVKSNYSFLTSLVKIDKLIKKCVDNNIKNVALLDDDMISTMHFYKECMLNNIKPIIGIDFVYDEKHILLYAMDFKGYQCLIKLNTIKCERDVTDNDLKELSEQVLCIVPYDNRDNYDFFKNIYSTIYLGYSSKEEEFKALKIASRVVFLNKVLYLDKKDSKYLKYAIMIRTKKNIMDDIEYVDDNNYLLGEEVLKLSSEDGLNTTNFIANMCNVVFPKGNNLIPTYKTSSDADSDTYLMNLCVLGLKKRRNGIIEDNYKERLLYELDIIKNMGYSNYFLIVYDYVKFAKKSGILVSPRGSAGGSLVSYVLGIIDFDPIEYNLLFERFLNPGRIDKPDIDIDFADIYRDNVVDYVKDKYGIKNVAGIIAIGTMKAKAALDDVARVLKIQPEKVDRLKRYLVGKDPKLKDAYEYNPDFKNIIDNDDRLALLYEVALYFENFPRNITTHASGVVISGDVIDDIVPLIMQDGNYATGYEMGYLEELGLIKMDFLGNRNLTIIMNVLDTINKNGDNDLNFQNIPIDDIDAIKVFHDIDTNGIFQFESDVMKNLLRRLKPTDFNDIIAANALVRPGPMDSEYIARRHDESLITYLDNCLEPILKDTYGVMLYQEQIMQVASVMAGYSLSEADLLRRAMSKKKKETFANEEEKFINNALALGHSYETSKKVFELISNFAEYGFNKSHTVAYSIIASRMAYLKAKYPKHFYAGILSYGLMRDSKVSTMIKEAIHKDVKFILPDINKSGEEYLTYESGIVFPLSDIKGIGINLTNEIVKIRGEGFRDIFDSLIKLSELNINKKSIETLIYAGTMRSFGYNINTLIENLDSLLTYAYLAKGLDPDSEFIEKPNINVVDEFKDDFLMAKEKELFGFYLTHHPVTPYKLNLKVADIKDVEKHIGSYVDVVILVDKIKTHVDKNGNTMAFIQGGDELASIECIMFSKVYDSIGNINKGDILLVKGKVDKRSDISLIIEKVKKLNI